MDHNLDTIDVLIGSDHYWDIVTEGITKGTDGPVAISSNWVLSRPSESMEGGYTVSNLGREVDNGSTQDDAILIQDLCRFWETEAIGIADITG